MKFSLALSLMTNGVTMEARYKDTPWRSYKMIGGTFCGRDKEMGWCEDKRDVSYYMILEWRRVRETFGFIEAVKRLTTSPGETIKIMRAGDSRDWLGLWSGGVEWRVAHRTPIQLSADDFLAEDYYVDTTN